MSGIDATRHLKIFDPDKFGARRVDIVGVGATGSRIAMSIAKLGVRQLHLWDFDVVEPHNIPNQVFGNGDVGKPKVEALAARIEADTGTKVYAHNEKVTGRTRLGDYVFLLTDTMSSRKDIWEGAIRWKPSIKVMVETRMGSVEGRIYAVSPTNPDTVKAWEATLFSDEDKTVERSLCGTQITVGPTAEIISGMAVWTFIDTWRHEFDRKIDAPPFETIFGVIPMMAITR